MNRIFFFGCSYTHFAWPTWADLVGVHLTGYDIAQPEVQNHNYVSYNFGVSGSSNSAITQRILTAHAQYGFSEGDTVCVQWTSKYRHSIAKTIVEHDRIDYADPNYSVSHCFWQQVTARHLLNKIKADCGANIFEFDFDAAESEQISDVTDFDANLLHIMHSHSSGNSVWADLARHGGHKADDDPWYDLSCHIDAHPSPREHASVARAVLHHLNAGELSEGAVAHSEAAQDLLLYQWNNSEQLLDSVNHTVQPNGDPWYDHEDWRTLTQVVRLSYVSEIHSENGMSCEPHEDGSIQAIQRLLNG